MRYMLCLRENSHHHDECRQQAKDYLQCRMDKYVSSIEYVLLVISFVDIIVIVQRVSPSVL